MAYKWLNESDCTENVLLCVLYKNVLLCILYRKSVALMVNIL